MSIKKTEDYVYFQNKASHYSNIIKAKSRLDMSQPRSLRKTIDYHDIRNAKKHQPHLREFLINYDNDAMMKRILEKKNKDNQLRSSPLNK
jgi:hypothetical protein